jgi:hypothetical protein
MGTDFVTPTPVTLSELSVDPSTGRYRATRPVASEKQVDTKAEISKIRADRTRDAEASASARQFIQEHSDEITAMRAPKPSKKLLNYYKKKLAAQKATSEK